MEYQDADGNPMSLYRLVREEPDWAANRIEFMNKRIAELEKVAADADEVSFFAKYNEFPEIGTSEFNEFTILLNKLDIGLKALKEGK